MENALKTRIQNEALKTLLPHPRGGAALSMGIGKTRLGLRHMLNIRHFRMFTRFLVVAPFTTIHDSWKNEARDELGMPELLDNITFCTYRSLNKQSHDYDVIYLDECHSLKESHKAYLEKFPGFIVGLTGTPPRYADSEKGKMVERFCPIRYTYLTDEAVEENILNDYNIFIHRIPLSTVQNLKLENKNGGHWYTSERDSYDHWTEIVEDSMGQDRMKASIMRMQAMMKFRSKEEYLPLFMQYNIGKTLIFATSKAQADRIGGENVYYSGLKASKENLEAFKAGKIRTLVAVNQLSQGVNIPNLSYGVIMHAYGNERTAAQKFGRFLRLPTDQKCYVHVLVYKDTVDEIWVERALQDFDQNKIFEFDLYQELC